jgi:tetratricopeptide (TPR) repeat protein
MKRLLLVVSMGIILLLLAACNPTPSGLPGVTPVPSETLLVTPSLAPTGGTVVGPPEPTTDAQVTSAPLLCNSTNVEARQEFSLAISLKDQGQDDQVEKLYLKAIELDPMFCDAMNGLGQLLRLQGRLDEAAGWFSKSLAIHPDNLMAYTNLGVIYLKQGDYGLAIDAYTRFMQIAPDSPEGYYGLGRVYFTMNEWAVAINHFTRAEELYTANKSPYLIDAQYYLGLCYFGLDEYVAARNYLIKIYDLETNDGMMNYVLGLCYLRGDPIDLNLAGQFFVKAQALDVVIPPEVLTEMENAAR